VKAVLLMGTIFGEIAWTPICVFFVRQWLRRRNPISMAIAILVAFIMVLGLAPLWLLDQKIDEAMAMGANMVLNFVVVINFYLSFFLSAKRFPDSRG